MKKSNLFKHIFAYTLVLSVIFSQMVFSFGASAAEVNSVWDGTKAENFAGGDGSAASPFLIDTAEQLYKMVVDYSTRTASEGKYFKITDDIYLNAVQNGTSIVSLSDKKNWLADYGTTIPTASAANSFAGSLDGGNHTIYGLYGYNAGSAGLFAAISNKTEVKNLNFNNILITGGSGGGGAIAGKAFYSTSGIAKITNCSVENSTIGQWNNKETVGGLVGDSRDCTITFTDCYSNNVSLSDWQTPGGIVGACWNGGTLTLKNCYSAGYFPVRSSNSKAVCTNVYTDTAIPEGNTTAGVTVLTSEHMKGANAKTNMTGFDFKYTWETVEGAYPVLKSDPVYVWDGTTGTSSDFDGGTGTADDPFLISNASQLAYIAFAGQSPTSGKYYKITKDIRINDTTIDNWKSSARNWVWYDARFAGHLDGAGHTIDGLFYNGNQWKRGLFSYVGGGSIKNLKFTQASVTTTYSGEGSAAIVAAQLSAAESFSYIYVDETCEINAPNAKGVAAIAPWGGNGATIDNCAVLTDNIIGGEGKYVGAIFGTLWSGTKTVTNCFTASSLPISGNQSFTGSNNYALVADSSGTTVLSSADDMKGAAAATNMPGLDFEFIWKTVENDYPIIRDDALIYGNLATADSFAGGQGTASDPYVIKTAEQLKKMVADYSNTNVAEKPESHTYFKIANDIDLSGKQWYTHSIWSDNPNNVNYTTGFSGIIYGEGHTISGLTVNGTTSYSTVGLIPVATQGAEIHDLNLKNGKLKQTGWNGRAVGAFIGLAVGSAGSAPIVIDSCSVKDFNISSENGSAAFVAYSYSQSISIKNCYCTDVSLVNTVSDADSNSGVFVAVTNGSDTNNSIVIENSFCDDVKSTILHKINMASITTFNNVYTQDSDYANTVTGLTKLTSAQMQGSAAIDNLVGFNFNQVWSVGEAGEYPTLKSCAEKALYWSGTAADAFAGGNGTANNPYLISNAEQLYLLATLGTDETYGKYYQLTNDINISRVYTDWEEQNPYKWTKKTAYLDGFAYSNSFSGILDGAGYTVSGLFIEDTITNGGTYAYGLMPLVSAGAVIKNITVDNVYADITGNAYAGAVAGAAHVTEDDISNPLNMVQFVGVDADNCDITATQSGDILGLATRGVKFELCNAETLYGSGNTKISVRNCNSAQSYSSNVRIYNRFNTDASALTNIVGNLIGSNNLYITDINGDSNFDIRDLVSAKKALTWSAPEESLVWSQEFGGNAMDYSVWTKNTSMSRGSTLVYADNAVVNNGKMTMSCADIGNTDTNGDKIYSVNYGLDTLNTMSFKYGRLEMRAKVPFSAGAFPSLWLTSRNAIGYDKYSEYSSEIDIFEVFAKSGNENSLLACVHKWYNDENGVKTGDECSSGTNDGHNEFWQYPAYRGQTFSSSEQAEWHTFVFEWDENLMTFKVDGTTYYTVSRSVLESTVFDKDGYDTDVDGLFEQALAIRLNNHMYTPGEGSAYSYNGSTTIDPSKLNYEIDYIRLYQKNNGKINFE